MDIKKQLAISIVKFLKSELESQRLGDDGSEALEVAVQCLENAYVLDGIKSDDKVDLLTIYEAAFSSSGTSIGTSMPSSQIYPDASQVNKEMAESKKIEGNDYMRDGKFNEAIISYTNAIDLDPNNAIYYSNRAAAYAKLNDNKNSIADCERALRIDPQYSKAYGRMGLAHFNDECYEKSIAAYENALALDPANQPYRVQLESAREKLNAKVNQNSGQAGASAAAPNPLAGMDLGSLLSNPAVMNMAQNFMSNPQVQNMFANMMGGAGGGAPGAPDGSAEAPQQNTVPPPPPQGAAAPDPNQNNPVAPPFNSPFGNIDFSTVFNATSQFAQQMQQQNPEMVENLRAQFQQGQMPNNAPGEAKKDEPK